MPAGARLLMIQDDGDRHYNELLRISFMNIIKTCWGESVQPTRLSLKPIDYVLPFLHTDLLSVCHLPASFVSVSFQNRHRDVHEVIQKERSAREQPFSQLDRFKNIQTISNHFNPFPKDLQNSR